MKNIVVFCDGTWNSPKTSRQTHVTRLYNIVRKNDDPDKQVSIYQLGVGLGRGETFIERATDVVGGGAFGWGLSRNIVEAYEKIIDVYDPGDRLFLFGFSRGAYTARSLAGLIRACGIPHLDQKHRVPEAMAWYRSRDPKTHPADDRSAAFRFDFAPAVTTGDEEREWRAKNGKPAGIPLTVTYLGVWDTVGALGVPGFLGMFAKLFNAKYAFHDHKLSRSVQSGRHAVSVDERRRLYEPTLWVNPELLESDLTARRYKQQWFAGDHGVVGGMGEDLGLANYALNWIAEGAVDVDLALDLEALRAAFPENADRPVSNSKPNALLSLISRDREFKGTMADVAQGTVDKIALGHYDPKPLEAVRDQIAAAIVKRTTGFG
ncbi:uncharacterized protein (DUF2235 family) [Rubricella aquisinus]|uniref:Uncharacterized protein (DUF2235 family) n=1 Tax=Rubricella aquisinus TaxID=2028108 RepID=A0A840WH16_9RHOB|nr:DUF2235 domain-containing protein [Rubricella aquisinus]MBB5514408.1 uncharacterized protein (DUF2235 family) [Rubricella aquisinus]